MIKVIKLLLVSFVNRFSVKLVQIEKPSWKFDITSSFSETSNRIDCLLEVSDEVSICKIQLKMAADEGGGRSAH